MKPLKKMQSNLSQQNVTITLICFCIVFLIFVGRSFQITILKNANKQNIVDYVKQEEAKEIIKAHRGSIFDRKGVPIAWDTDSYDIYVVINHPNEEEEIQDLDQVARALGPILGIEHDDLLERLRQPNLDQIELGEEGRNLSHDVKNEIEALNLAGIHFKQKIQRHYANGHFASHMIGYAKLPEESDNAFLQLYEGQLGIERAYDRQLSGRSEEVYQGTIVGSDVYVTLDSRLQNVLEDLMTKYDQQYMPQALNAYLVKVETGELLAASQRATFDLNTREGIEEQWRNLLVGEAYEPGSTIKILTMSVAYDQKLYRQGELYRSGSIQVYDTVVKDYNKVGWGDITFEEGLARSSNVAMVTLVNRLGDQAWVKRLEAFGFGKTTESGLEEEVPGSLDFDNPVSRTMSSFGQGFSVTPMQLLQAFSSVGNHGKMMKIQYLKKLGMKQFQPQVLGQPISPEAADHVLGLMVNAVEQPYGTAQSFKNQYVSVAAKTGTAQIASPDGKGYLTGPDDYYHSVVAFFPAEAPKYMMYLSMKQPGNSQGQLGSQMLGVMFNDYVDYIMSTE